MNLLILAASALATGLCYTFRWFGFAAYFSLIPLFYLMIVNADKRKHPVKAYFYGYFWGVIYYASIFYWFVYQYPLEYLGFSKAEAIGYVALTWFGTGMLLSFLLALWQLSFSLFAKSGLYRAHKWLFIPFVSSVYVILEFVFTLGKLATPWARLAVTQQAYTVGLQTASVFGSYFLSFLIVFVNACLAYGIYARNTKNKKLLTVFVSVALGAVILNYAAGTALYFTDKSKTDSLPTYHASALQGNYISGRADDDNDWEILDKFLQMSQKEKEDNGVKLFVVPEGSFSLELEESELFKCEIVDFCKKNDAVMIIGCYQRDNGKLYNVAWCISPDGSVTGPYRKQHPVPFGEFTPAKELLLKIFPFIEDVTGLGDELSGGTETTVMDSSVGRIGCFICFDSAFEKIGVDAVRGGAVILTEMSNDSWWMDSSQLYEHNGHAVLRAIETRRCIVRSTVSGYSTVMNSRGEVIASVGALTEGAATAEVYNRTDISFYAKHPYLFLSLCFACALCLPVCAAITGIKSKRQSKKDT